MNSCVWAWLIHCPLLCLHPFPSRAAPLYRHSSLLRDDHFKLHKRFGCGEVRSTDCSDAHSEFCKWHLPGKNTAASISSRFPSTQMELTPPFKISLRSLNVDSALLLLLSIYYPCQARRPRLTLFWRMQVRGGESKRGSGFFFLENFSFQVEINMIKCLDSGEVPTESKQRQEWGIRRVSYRWDFLSKPGNTDFPDWRHLPKQVCDSYSADNLIKQFLDKWFQLMWVWVTMKSISKPPPRSFISASTSPPFMQTHFSPSLSAP